MVDVTRGARAVLLVVAAWLAMPPVWGHAEADQGVTYERPVLIRFEGTITPMLSDYVPD